MESSPRLVVQMRRGWNWRPWCGPYVVEPDGEGYRPMAENFLREVVATEFS